MADAAGYMIWGGVGILVLALVATLNVIKQRQRLRKEARLTPEERALKQREDKVFRGVLRRGP